MNFNKLYVILLILVFSNCSKQQTKENLEISKNEPLTLFEIIPQSHSNISFKNEVKETLYFNFLNYSYIYNGGGVAVGDINNDGLEDLYFSANQGKNKLYLNKGDFIFEDITQKAGVFDEEGWSTGVSMIDINADGWIDIYVCKSGSLRNNEARKNKLYINQKNGTFVESASQYGVASSAFSTQAYYLDFDKDGDLDIYLVNHRPDFNNNVTIDPRIQSDIREESTDQLFENIEGKFKDITQKSGISNKAWGLSASIGDFNEDGWPDVYVANDFLESDFLYINNQDGTFSNTILDTFDHIAANSMGSDYADINNDLKPDLVVLDMLSEDHQRSKENMATMSTENFNLLVNAGYHHQYMSNMLQLNLGKGVYSEVGQLAGIAKTDWSWAPLLADFDNDGFNDLFVTNGILHDLSNQDFRNKMKANIMNRKKVTLDEAIAMMPSTQLSNKIFQNNGDVTFSPVTKEWGLEQKMNSNGVAYADLDNDGDQDLILNNQMETASIYKNNQNKNFITFSVTGAKNNPNSIGTKVSIYTKEGQQSKQLYPVRGFQSSVSHRLHFGIGDINVIDSVLIDWSEGKHTRLKSIKGNQIYKLAYNDSDYIESITKRTNDQLKIIDAERFGITYRNVEKEFDDYKLQLLLPQKQSEKGKALAVADINNDGRDDFFVGNAKGAAAEVYVQKNDGTFTLTNQTVFSDDKNYEDNDAIFFDMDNDGDQDLYVASGSYEEQEDSTWLKDRIYENDGKGNFTKKNILPEIISVTTAVVAEDYDKDGDLDLFIGGNVISGKYPQSYPSYLLKNEKGKFINATNEDSEGFDNLHMVNDAIFSDYDQDGDKDLVVVGEWMPIQIFNNDNGTFTKSKNDLLDTYSGWYFTIEEVDFDKDGDMDYVVGNLGKNNKFNPKKDKPFHIYAKDFDSNGSLDIVLSKESKEGILLPVRGKECSSEQIPGLNQKFKTYKEFASASLLDIYGKQDLNDATHYTASNFESIILINKGNGDFDVKKLPILSQYGPTTDIVISDFDKDGNKDIFGLGSIYEAEVETVRYDANKGYFLFGKNRGYENTKNISAALPNLQTKTAELISIDAQTYLMIASKNNGLKFVEYTFD
ncbi:VCBS repeat-containing protein [Aquimarina sp. 2201CG5-10]|uniref:VCBS repeat-containing protein n=1 Tax=Aquimarina callyspongiae TaxID=3098150 RepID=UPI002AB5B4CA|nr:VCBS repeat-containing protein [Aquimarina sp. 2201CG5-10]MDY8135143.1 VCBS repeat-containing protein [Aquimarina sp. 2201CG5-10]